MIGGKLNHPMSYVIYSDGTAMNDGLFNDQAQTPITFIDSSYDPLQFPKCLALDLHGNTTLCQTGTERLCEKDLVTFTQFCANLDKVESIIVNNIEFELEVCFLHTRNF